ncbi:hypothetical protein B0T24DRAFT_496519, partial [Lasiosphaeria ovina]
QCSCSGLDYTNGGSYLIDGTSDRDFTFTSTGACFASTITPILISPDGFGYQCSPIASNDGDEQPSECGVAYYQMRTGTWSIIIQAPDFDFTVQRQFNLTVGGAVNTVVDVTTEYAEPDFVTSDCYLPTDTVIYYVPGPTSHIVNTISRWSTLGPATQYYTSTIVDYAYCHWP